MTSQQLELPMGFTETPEPSLCDMLEQGLNEWIRVLEDQNRKLDRMIAALEGPRPQKQSTQPTDTNTMKSSISGSTRTLNPEVHDVLTRSIIDGNILILPTAQLQPKLYQAVKKVIELAGGKWKTGKGFLFTSDPREKLGLIVSTGKVVDHKKRLQAFYTPQELAARVVQKADVKGFVVMEPSAGNGALLKEIHLQGAADSWHVEINAEAQAELVKTGYKGTCSDFLNYDTSGPIFHRIVMNPPFTRNADIRHVEHALKCLAPNGRLVAIMSSNTDRPQFKALVAGLNHEIEEVAEGAFKASGTNIKTIILTVRK